MKRVVIAPWMATVGVGLLTFFAVGGMAIGALMLGGAAAVAKNTGSSTTTVMITGAIIGVIGAVVLAYCRHQWVAVREISVDGDGWILVDRLGRVSGVDAGATVELALRCRRVVYTWGGIPRIRDVVDGWLTSGSTRRRLAPSGPHTYGGVLAQLGADGGPPARGTSKRYRVTA